MRILWVNPNFLHPTTKGGQIRTLGILRELHREHEVHYAAYREPGDEEGPSRASEYSKAHYAVPSQTAGKASPRFYFDLMRGLVDPMPVAVRRFDSLPMRQLVARLRSEIRFDVLVADFLAAAPAFADIEQAVLFQHNVESMIWQRRAERAESLPERLYLESQHRRMLRYEGEICRRAQKVIAVSELDARMMEEKFGVKDVGWTDTGVDVDYFTPGAERPGEAVAGGEIVFVGSMDWMPNVDGMLWFMREVWPRILASRPETTLAIVGRRPPEEIGALASHPGIRVTGTVPDVRPYLWQSKLSIVPLRIGGGTRLKIYEAMAARTPVVSTAIGSEGLAGQPGRELLLADDPERFAEACLSLLRDEQEREAIAANAWEMVDRRFRWRAVARDFAGLLKAARVMQTG